MARLAVIDDDPTGAQSEAGVPLLLEWPAAALRERDAGAVHFLTNSRALDERAAYAAVRDAVESARSAMPERRVVLRGDSTLRGHLLAEYEAVRDSAFPGRHPTLVLVPALPSAGRVTIGGIHWLERDRRRVPLAETEYARDRTFGYTQSRLVDWAQERSGGHFRAEDGREVPLAALRGRRGSEAIVAALQRLAESGRPAVLVPDAETADDLAVIARGVESARKRGIDSIVRCGPAFVGVAAGTSATGLIAPPRARRGVLVVVGSHVATTTRQLDVITARHPGALIELDPRTLAAAGGGDMLDGAATRVRTLLAADGIAIVATSRDTPAELLAPEPGMRIARALAGILARARDAADVVVSKGGITSAVNVREGFGAREALVIGPIADGIALWRLPAQGDANVVVFPGNVGADDALATIVDRLRTS